MRLVGKIMVFAAFWTLITGPLAAQETYEAQGIAVTDRPLPPAFDGNKGFSSAKVKASQTASQKKKSGKKTKKKAKSGKKKTTAKAKKKTN